MNRLRSRPDSISPLSSTELDIAILDLTAEYTIRHSFRNTGEDALEAIYSFPIPLDAAFIAMEALLAGERCQAQVLPARQASLTYDDAISEGDSAVLIEQVEPGLLCVNLGNLKAGETGEIELRFAAFLGIADRTARFSLPLVHRPRYGRSSLDEIVEPGHDFAVEHPMQATIRVSGLLAGASVQCASHAARFTSSEGELTLELPHAMLDRDVVINFDLKTDLSPTARLIADGTDAIGMLSFVVPASKAPDSRPLDLCVVMDGSGSMSGDAIAQSRAALRAVTADLNESDRIQALRFGSSIIPMFRRPLRATAKVREALDTLCETIDSNLGGTEIGSALEQAIKGLGSTREEGRNAAIMLVTDGAVQPVEIGSAQAAALAAGIRIFVVAVGSSAGADVLAPLAEATGAVLERAVPAEPIEVCVMRQFRRAREAAPAEIDVDWITEGARPLPAPVCYPGDAVMTWALLPGSAAVEARVNIAGPVPTNLRFALSQVETVPALRSLAGQMAYRHAGQADRPSLALHYGLLTRDTSAMLVKTRAKDDKADGLPTVRPVQHMVPEGLVASRAYRHVGQVSMACARILDPVTDTAFNGTDAKSHAAPAPDFEIEEILPAMPASRVIELIDQLYLLLLDDMRVDGMTAAPLADVLERLDAADRADARRLIEAFSVVIDRPGLGALLMFLILQARDYDGLSDEEEAEMAVAIADYDASSTFLAAKLDVVKQAILKGIPARQRKVPSQSG